MPSGGQSTPTTQTTIQKSEPPAYARPFIEEMLSGASQRYQGDQPQYFPGSTVVPFSPETQQALSMGTERATTGSPIQQAGSQEYLSTIQGDYLDPNTNPYLKATQQAAVQPAINAFNEQVLPGVTSAFSAAGRYGSPAMQNNVLSKVRGLQNNLVGQTAPYAYQQYNTERGNQLGAATGAPGYAAQDYNDISRLAQIGGQKEAQSAQELADQVNRWNFGQNVEGQKLGEYANLIGQGTFGGQTTGQTTIPYYSNPAMQYGGLGLGLGSLGLQAAGK